MRNLQSRRIAASAEEVGALLARLAGPEDELWPAPAWPALRLRQGLVPGSRGGHGPIRYCIEEYVPGTLLRCRFDPRSGLEGAHELRVTADGPRSALLTHVIEGRTVGRGRVLWPVAIRWLHQALIHDLFDNAELLATGRIARGPARWPMWVRLLRSTVLRSPVPRAASASPSG